jgi:hypothetical protein
MLLLNRQRRGIAASLQKRENRNYKREGFVIERFVLRF